VALQLRPATEATLERMVGDLADEFASVVERPTVEQIVQESVQSLSDARFDDFVPVLAYRLSRDRLLVTSRRG
jgi:uncharacterized membrane protein YheB (UPF0754 family)